MSIKINDLIKNNEIPNLCLLYGSEDYLRCQFRDKLINSLMPQKDNMNLSSFVNNTGKVEDSRQFLSELISIANTVPFFSDKRVICCENTGFFKNKFEEIPPFLKELPSTTYIIFCESEISKATVAYKTISKLGFCEEYSMPDRASLVTWIRSRLKKENKSIDTVALNEFIIRTGVNMSNMDRELSKLISYCLDKEVITKDDIDRICVPNYEEQIFNIVNAISNRNTKLALTEYSYLYKLKTSPMALLGLLTNKFSLILNISLSLNSGMSKQEIATNLDIKSSYAMDKNIEIVNNFSIESLKKILNLSLETNSKIKTGLLNEQTGVEIFIMECLKA